MREFTERETLEIYIYEGHKDAFGYKGRHYDFASMSLEQLKDEADWIECRIADAVAERQIEEDRAIKSFQAQVSRVREAGAIDYDTAIRWLYESERGITVVDSVPVDHPMHEQDIEQWVWEQGFLFTDYGKQLVERLVGLLLNSN